MRSDLPTGTVTLLFTDIEGSTRHLRALGEGGYAEALAAHRRTIRAALARHGGVEVDNQGDAVFAAFATAPAALAAASECQAELARGPLRVRMGLHTGTPRRTDEGYVGVDVHRAARIAAAAHGGQIVLSETTRALAAGLACRDLGAHALRDIGEPERLYQLGAGEFPPLRSLGRTNLPKPPTSFVGRERELADLLALLDGGEARLITVTGPGGTGKTRLALEAARERVDAFPDGAFWVPLEALRDPSRVLPTLAREIDASGAVAAHVGAKRLLAVLDNFEQVAGAAAEIAALLAACPRLVLVVTSREALRVAAERELAVAPLASADAEALFCARARAALPAFADDGAVGALCRRLEGIPLAIELAASRVKLLSPRALLARLQQRLPLLTGGAADAPERQRTLRAAIAWSHDLLSPEEQRAFARLAVFSGGFALEDAEAVTGASLDVLGALVDKSLVRRDGERLAMLETIREFASERLAASGEGEALRRAHAEHFLALLERAVAAIRTPDEIEAFRRTQAELDNLRAAFAFAVESVGGDLALRIALARSLSLRGRNDRSEARGWIERALPLTGGSVAQRALAHAECASDALAHDIASAERHALAAREHALEAGDLKTLAGVVRVLCIAALERGDFAASTRHAEESLALSERSGNRQSVLIAQIYLGYAKRGLGAYEDAARHFAEAAEGFGALGDALSRAHALHGIADCRLEQGRLAEAKHIYHDVIHACVLLEERGLIAHSVAGLAAVAVEEAQAEDAARLWGAVEAAERREQVEMMGFERAIYDVRIARARAALGEAAFAAAHAEGVALSERVREVAPAAAR